MTMTDQPEQLVLPDMPERRTFLCEAALSISNPEPGFRVTCSLGVDHHGPHSHFFDEPDRPRAVLSWLSA